MERPGPFKQHILLVDDDPEVLDVQARMLGRLGYCVTAFREPQEAFARFRDDPCRFDLVITDEIMAGLRGTEMAALIRGIRPDLPVMIVTAGLEVERTRGRTKALHMGNVFLKPLDRNALAAAIDAILRRGRRKKKKKTG